MCSRNTTNIGYRSIFPDKVSTFSQKKNEDHKTKCGLQAFFFFFLRKGHASIRSEKSHKPISKMRTCPLWVPLQTGCRKSGAERSHTQAMGLGR